MGRDVLTVIYDYADDVSKHRLSETCVHMNNYHVKYAHANKFASKSFSRALIDNMDVPLEVRRRYKFHIKIARDWLQMHQYHVGRLALKNGISPVAILKIAIHYCCGTIEDEVSNYISNNMELLSKDEQIQSLLISAHSRIPSLFDTWRKKIISCGHGQYIIDNLELLMLAAAFYDRIDIIILISNTYDYVPSLRVLHEAINKDKYRMVAYILSKIPLEHISDECVHLAAKHGYTMHLLIEKGVDIRRAYDRADAFTKSLLLMYIN